MRKSQDADDLQNITISLKAEGKEKLGDRGSSEG